jgi:DNA invertase Pin-like site-specific DNA recombinase
VARALGYLRVSTDEQAASGLGLDAQRAAIAAAAARLELPLERVFSDEGVSGSKPPRERAEFGRLLEELRQGDVVVVAKRDRLGRVGIEVQITQRDIEELGARVRSAAGEGTEDDTPSSRLMRWILDGFAQYELDVIRERTQKASAAKRARGERTGTVPFGYTVGADGKLVADLEEQRALELMRGSRGAGASFGAICRELAAAGCRPRGKRWHPEGVRSILATDARARTS